MSEQTQLNFNIPKIKRQLSKDNLRNISLTSRDATELLQATDRCYLDQDIRGQWEVKAIQTFDNRELEREYREKRSELKDDGRHARELVEQYAFLYVKDSNLIVPSIAKNGLRTKAGSFSGLGDSKSGVYVCKHPDVQLKLADQKEEKTACILVFKVTLGRCKAQQMSSSPDTVIEPTPNYDSHVSVIAAQTNTAQALQLQRSQIYLYEYTDEALPSERPRHCLPHALLQYEKKGSTGASSYGQYSRSSYGTKSTVSDYSWKSSQWKSRVEVTAAPRRSSYEASTTYMRQESLTGSSPLTPPVMPPSSSTYKIPSVREDPRIARKRNSTDKMDIPVDPRQASDPRLAQNVTRMGPNDPRFDPRLAQSDPRIASGDPRIASGDPRLAPGDPRIASGDPRLASGDPRIASGDPRLASGDPRLASGDPRIASGDPRSGQRMTLQCAPGPYGTVDNLLGLLKPDQKTISPEMKSMIKTVEQLWGTTTQDETAITSEDQAGNSVLKQVQEQMEQKKAEAKEKRKKISFADYSTRFKQNEKQTSVKSGAAVSSVPTITSVPVPTIPVTAVDVLPALTTVTTATETVPSARKDHDAASAAFTEETSQIFPPSRFSHAGSSVMTPVKTTSTICSPALTPTAVPAPVPAPVPPPSVVPTSSQSPFPTPPVLPPIVPYPMSAPPILLQSDADSPKSSVYDSSSDASKTEVTDPSAHLASPIVSLCSKVPNPVPTTTVFSPTFQPESFMDSTANIVTENKFPTVTTQCGSPKVSKDFTVQYSPKGSADYKDPYAAVKKNIQVEYSNSPQCPAQKSPVSTVFLSNPFARDLPKSQVISEPQKSPPKLDLRQSPVKKDFSKLPVSDTQQSPLSEVHKSPVSPFSTPEYIQGVQTKSASVGSPATVPPQTPISGPSVPASGTAQHQGQQKDSSHAYVKDLVSKLQSIGDFKDIISKMGLKGTVQPKSPVTAEPPAPVERYREIGATVSLPVSDSRHQSYQDVDQRQQRFMDSPQHRDTRHDESGWESWRSSPRDRVSRFSQPRYRGPGYDDLQWKETKDDEERYQGGSRPDDYWGGHAEDVDLRRHDERRYRYGDDDQRSYANRYERRSYVRRNSPRHEDASKFGDFDYRTSRYHSPRRGQRNSGSDGERRDFTDGQYEDWKRKSSSGDGDEFRVVDEYVCSDADESDKSGFEQRSEKSDDLGVWMAPRIEGGEVSSDLEMTPVKPSTPIKPDEQVSYFSSDRGFEEKPAKRNLFSPKGRKTEQDNVSVKSTSSSSKAEEGSAVSQARSWAEVIEQEDKKEKQKVTEVDKENKQAKVPENGKKVKKRKVDKVMAGYKRRKKRKKKTLTGRVMDDVVSQKSWSPCPSDNFSIEYDNDEIDYADFSFDMPHSYVETIPNSDDDYMSTTTGTTTPTVDSQHHLEDITDKPRLLPHVQLVDFRLVSESTHGNCSKCTDVARLVRPHVRLLYPCDIEDKPNLQIKSEPKEETKPITFEQEQKIKCEPVFEKFKEMIDFKPVPPPEEKPLPKSSEYYTRNCLPGLDLIVPEESIDSPVHHLKTETKEAKTDEEKVDVKDVKPIQKQEIVEESKRGYNSIEGDRPLHLKFQKSPIKSEKEIEKSSEKETKSESKSGADEELDINGTHNTFNPMKGIMKRKLSITLCVGGKKKKSEVKSSSALFEPSAPVSKAPVSAAQIPTASNPASTLSTTAVASSVLTRSIPTVQYKMGVKKSQASVPVNKDTSLIGEQPSNLQLEFSQMVNSALETLGALPKKSSGNAIPVLGMSRASVTPQVQSWTPVDQTPVTQPNPGQVEAAVVCAGQNTAQTRWPTTFTSTSFSGQPLVLGSHTLTRPPVVSGVQRFVPPQVNLRHPQSNLTVRPPQQIMQQFPPRPVPAPVMVPPPNPNLQHPPVQSSRFSQPPHTVQHQTMPTSTGLPVRPQQIGIRQPPCTLPGQTIPTHGAQAVRPMQPIVRPQHPMSQPHGLQHLNTAYPPPPLPGNTRQPLPNYQYPQITTPCMVPHPPQGVSSIPIIGQHQPRPPVPHPVPPPVSHGQPYSPNLAPMQRPLFNPNQPPPIQPMTGRPISTLVTVPTTNNQPPPPPEPKKSSDPADWFADMFAPKPRESSAARESTPETGHASPEKQTSTREKTPDSQSGSNLWAMATNPSSSSASPNTQNPFLGESSRDVYAGEAMHTGKDTKISHSPSRRVVLKSVVTDPRASSPGPSSSHQRSSSPSSGHQPRDKLCKKPLDFLSKERDKILYALQNLQNSASDSEEGHDLMKREMRTRLERSSSEPRADRRTPGREIENESNKDPDSKDVRRVEFQKKSERRAGSNSRNTNGDSSSKDKRKDDDSSSHRTSESIRQVVRKSASDWSELLTSRDRKQPGKKIRDTVDYHDELMLDLCLFDPEKMEATDTPDDSSSVSGDSIEDLEELSGKLVSENNKDAGPNQCVHLTIETYLRYKLGVLEPNKVRDRIPWPLSTVLSQQTKHKRRRMVQKAKVVAAYYIKKLNSIEKFGNADKPGNDGMQLKAEPVQKERKLEDFTKEQILLELQVVQECIQKLSEASLPNKSTPAAAGGIGQMCKMGQTAGLQNCNSSLRSLERNMQIAQTTIKRLGGSLGLKNSGNDQNTLKTDGKNKVNLNNLSHIQQGNLNTQMMNNSHTTQSNSQDLTVTKGGACGKDDSIDTPIHVTQTLEAVLSGPLSRQKDALQQVASDLMESFQKLNFVGRTHQKVPDDILLASEKKKYHSEEGCFLILLSAISKKPYNRLLAMKMDIEKFVKHKLEAAARNQTGEVSKLKNSIRKLHEDRKKLLTTFTGSLGKKRLRKLNLVKTKYQVCVAHLKKELGLEGLGRLQYIATLYQTINTHVKIVQEELASPTL